MDYEELKQAAKVFDRIETIRIYVSKERFDKVATAKFGIDDERKLDIMYGMLNMTQKMVHFLANENKWYPDPESRRYPDYINLFPTAIEIAECAFEMMSDRYIKTIPIVECDNYKQEDRRRYFYRDNGKSKVLDIDLSSSTDIIILSDVLQKEKTKLIGVAEHLGYLEFEGKKHNTTEKVQYYEGDIYFLYGNPTDHVFYDWFSHGGDAGVYIATEKGWRKLLYTPGRGYIDRKGEVEYVEDDHFYSNYMLEASGKKFQYVGNIHHDISVLIDRKGKEVINER